MREIGEMETVNFRVKESLPDLCAFEKFLYAIVGQFNFIHFHATNMPPPDRYDSIRPNTSLATDIYHNYLIYMRFVGLLGVVWYSVVSLKRGKITPPKA